MPRLILPSALLIALMAVPCASAQPSDARGGAAPIPTHAEMPEAERAALLVRLAEVADSLRAVGTLPTLGRGSAVPFGWPVRASDDYPHADYFGISNFVDHDPSFPNALQDYQCGGRTYDLASGYNHQGLDIFTWPFGWHMMDNDYAFAVAAADGVILTKIDGNFDRRCSFNSSQWNAVYLAHADGSVTWYGHLKNGSLTPKGIGEAVQQGEVLGMIGSSGSSTGPHLHFEVYAAGNQLVDPYAGACNQMNEASMWAEQPDYYLPKLNAIITHPAPPSFPSCPNTIDVVNDAEQFDPGDTVHMAFYYRDQLAQQTTQYRVLRPDGTALFSWNHASNVPHYAASYWYWTWTVPPIPMEGVYTIEAHFNGETTSKTFTVGQISSTEDDAPLAFALDVFPNPAAATAHLTLRSTPGEAVRVVVYDLLGREVVALHDGPSAGELRLPVATDRLAPGTYVIRATSPAEAVARRLTVVR